MPMNTNCVCTVAGAGPRPLAAGRWPMDAAGCWSLCETLRSTAKAPAVRLACGPEQANGSVLADFERESRIRRGMRSDALLSTQQRIELGKER